MKEREVRIKNRKYLHSSLIKSIIVQVNVLMPSNPLIKKYVEAIYLFKRGSEVSEYFAYPSLHTAVALFRDADVLYNDARVTISPSHKERFAAMASNRLHRTTAIKYVCMVDEIAINFRPPGFSLFTGREPRKNNFPFDNWDAQLPKMMNAVFSTEDKNEQLAVIEAFLLTQYEPIECEDMIDKVIAMLCDFNSELSIQDIADSCGVHYKYLSRCFVKYVGCSAAHFRKVARFRASVQAKLRQDNQLNFTGICYDNNFTDQSYFIKQFKELTGESPGMFFKDVSSFADSHIVWKFL